MNWKTAIVLTMVLVVLDQGTKTVFGVKLPHVLNEGFAFGFGDALGPWVFFLCLSLMIFDAHRRGFGVPEISIIAGGIGNVLDRITRGAVFDWIHLWNIWFNLGDIWIAFGVGWIFLSFLRIKTSS